MLPVMGTVSIDQGGVMRTQRDRELIPLSEAAFRAYREVTSVSLSPFAGPVVDGLLHEAAQALGDLVFIYGASTGYEPLRPLPWPLLKRGTFLRAATVLRTSDGMEYERLYMRRGDARAAIRVLKKSRARFHTTEEVAAALESAEVRCEAASEMSALSLMAVSPADSPPSSEVAQ
jgi:hypothetical protein